MAQGNPYISTHVLPDNSNPLLPAWESLVDYVHSHDMKLNFEKTKVMLFNPGRKYDFSPSIRAPDGNYLEYTEQFKLLGVIIRTGLKWYNNTDYIFSRAMRKMWMLKWVELTKIYWMFFLSNISEA